MFDLFSRPAAILAAVMLFAAGVMPGTAQALGLGELSVESGSGEPLRLVIEVHSVSASEAETLDVSLAGRSDFAAAGVEYPSLADAMEFALVPLDQGGYQVVITTVEAVDDASLGLLVAATWAGGREVREYTASLAAAPSAMSVSVGSVEEEGESTEDAAVEDARPVAIPGEEFVVESGHTLSHIVLWMNVPEDLHRFRAYLAVFRENPRAFINENMNLIRSGAVLRLPTFDEIRTVTYSESVAAYSEQLDQFTAYQERVRQRRADPDPAPEPEPQIVDTVTEPEAVEPEAAPSAVTEEEPAAVEQPEAEVAEEPVPDAAEPVQVDVADPGQVTEPVETPPEIPEVEVTEEPAPAVEEPAGAQLTISQQADPEAVPAEDDAQALLKALESELAQMDETLLASGEETRNVQENLQQMQEQTGDISTLLEVENVPLATAQSRAAGEQEEDPDLPESVQADDGTTETPALESAEPQVSGVSDDDGMVETVGISDDQVAAPEEPAEVSAADAEPDTATGTDEILLAQQDTAPAEDEVPAVTGDAAVPAPAEPEEELQVAMVELGTQPETVEVEEAPADEVAAEADDGTAELPALDAAGALVSGAAGVVEIVKIPEDQDEDQAPAEDEPLAETMDPAVPELAEPDEAPAVEMAAEADDGTVELPALDSAEPMVSGVAGDDGVVEIVKIPEDQDAPEEPAEVSAADAEPATGSEEILLAQQDTAPAEEESMTVTVDPVVPALEEPEEAKEAPAGEVAVQADDGTTEAPAGESAEPMVSGVAGEDEVVETVGIPEDEAAPEEPAEIAEADAEPEAAAETDEILLAQQDTAPAEDEAPAVTVDPAVPAPEEQEEEPQVAVTVSGAQPEPADAPEAEPVSAVATDDGYGESAPVETRDGLLDWIKNVFAILPDYGPKIAVGLLALLAALFVWQRRKARRMSDDGDPGSSDGESPPESGTPDRSMHDAAGSDPARDPVPQEIADAGSADEGAEGAAASAEVTGEGGPSGEIDPVVEADVYLEYDRIEQAIEVLKDAWSVDPERGELAEKLLEIYHMQDDRWAFDSLAEELRARGGLSRNVNWDRIFAMGKEVSPNNPLFTGDVPLHEEPAAGPEEAADAPSPDPDDAGEEEPREESAGAPDADGEAPKPGDGGDGSVEAAAEESGAGESPDEEPDGESQDSEETEETEDESETALELARAYMDLGEREIARGYLEEVLKGGNEDQKKRAQDLIRELDD